MSNRPATKSGAGRQADPDPELRDLARRFGVEDTLTRALAGPDPDSPKEQERQRSLALDRGRDKPRPRPRPGPEAGVREFGGSSLGSRFAMFEVGATDYRRLRPMTRLFFGAFLWTYQPGRVWRRPCMLLGVSLGMTARTCERATSELRRFGYLARYGGGWICPPVELKLDPKNRVWKEQMEFEFIPDWETVNVSAARYLGLSKAPESCQQGGEGGKGGPAHTGG